MNDGSLSRKKFLFIFTIFLGFFLLNKVLHFPKLKNELMYTPPEKIVLGKGWKSQNKSANKAFKAAHGDFHNSDQVTTILGPKVGLDWISEKDKFIVEGPTVDSEGNLYFSPLWSPEEAILVSLEPKKGKRRWSLPGYGYGAGAPLILTDPKSSKEIIYVSVYHKAYALSTEGKVLWEVPTGLEEPKRGSRHKDFHCFGLNYLKKYDALVGLMGNGHLVVLDRETGKNLLEKPFILPGSPSAPSAFNKKGPPKWIKDKADKVLYPLAHGRSTDKPFSDLVDVLLGGGTKVANYFSIDLTSSRVWAAATAPDGVDHKIDDLSDYGALYGLDLVKKGRFFEFKLSCEFFFPGGSGSTPALSGDGKRVYIGTGKNSLAALDTNSCKKVWSFEVPSQIIASPAVDQSTQEIYIPTSFSIIKIKDLGPRPKKFWVSKFDNFKLAVFQKSFQMLTPLITPNGIVTFFGAGYKRNIVPIPLVLGIGLLDKESGKIRYYSKAREESVGILSMGQKGALYVTHSPVRRAVSRSLFSNLVDPLVGGVAKYSAKPSKIYLKEVVLTILAYEKNIGVGEVGNFWRKTLLDVLGQGREILTELELTSSFPKDRFDKMKEHFKSARTSLEKGDTLTFFSSIRKLNKQIN